MRLESRAPVNNFRVNVRRLKNTEIYSELISLYRGISLLICWNYLDSLKLNKIFTRYIHYCYAIM